VYNNPQSYVKYAKLERNITKLQKQLEDIIIAKPKDENDGVSRMAYYNFGIQILFYSVNAVFIYWFKDLEFVVADDNMKNKNIVFDYFRKDGNINIPMFLILVMEGIFVSNVLDNLDKMKKVFV
jgi:hypothetical protein